MRTRHPLPAILLLCLTLLPGIGQAADGGRCERQHSQAPDQPLGEPGQGMTGGPGPLPRLLHGLDLSKAQRDSVLNLMQAQAPALHARMKALRQARLELQALSRAERFDQDQAGKPARNLAEASAAVALQHAETEQRIWALLTPEQRNQAEPLRDSGDFGPVKDKRQRHGRGRAAG